MPVDQDPYAPGLIKLPSVGLPKVIRLPVDELVNPSTYPLVAASVDDVGVAK